MAAALSRCSASLMCWARVAGSNRPVTHRTVVNKLNTGSGLAHLVNEAKSTAPSAAPESREPHFNEYIRDHGGLYPRYTPGPGQITTKEFADLYSYLPQNARLAGITHTVAGRVLSRRTAGSKLVFYDIRQHGETLQVVAAAQQAAQQDSSKFASLHRALRKGDIIQVTGHPGRSKAGELSLFATEAVLLSPCLHDIPTEITDPPDHTDPQDIRTRQRHLEMLAGGNLVRTLRTRALINSKIRQFLDSRGFIEVETPILSSACGGARARPFVTRGNAADGDLFLRIAPELYLKRLLEVIPAILRPKLVITEQQLVIGGLEKVYEIGKQFRNEGVDATHNPEFTTCEFYQAYANIDDLIATTEFMLHDIALAVLNTPVVTVQQRGQECVSRLLEICHEHGLCPQCNSDNPYSNANPATLAPHTPSVLLDRLSAAFVEPMCLQPTFVVDIPAALSPLAKRQGPSSHLAARFELFIAGKEYCNAYEELNDPSEQRMRFKEQIQDRSRGDDEVPLPDVMFCSALEHALPPTGGWGLGIDRLAMLLAGHTHLRDVIAFPFTRPLS